MRAGTAFFAMVVPLFYMAATGIAQATAPPQSSDAPDASNRVQIVGANGPLFLGHPGEIILRIDGAWPLSIGLIQRTIPPPERESGRDLGALPESLDQRDGGRVAIQIVPLALGNLQVEVTGRFADGGIYARTAVVHVLPPKDPPERLIVKHLGGSDSARIVMAMKGGSRNEGLFVFATYPGLARPVRIDPTYVKFRIVPGAEPSPVHLEPGTGALSPIHPGETLIETSFGGRMNRTCVDVEEVLVPNKSYAYHHCQALLAAGERLGAVQ